MIQTDTLTTEQLMIIEQALLNHCVEHPSEESIELLHFITETVSKRWMPPRAQIPNRG